MYFDYAWQYTYSTWQEVLLDVISSEYIYICNARKREMREAAFSPILHCCYLEIRQTFTFKILTVHFDKIFCTFTCTIGHFFYCLRLFLDHFSTSFLLYLVNFLVFLLPFFDDFSVLLCPCVFKHFQPPPGHFRLFLDKIPFYLDSILTFAK